jgi:VIT1/CCC1 family predicted Fe2+/Mn2+ transporter
MLLKTSRVSFGGTAAIVTSMAIVTGLNAVSASEKTIITALLIAALADNLTDSLSVHVYQESERLEEKEAFKGTLTNFVVRLVLCVSFAILVATLPTYLALVCSIVWGMLLLGILSYVLAKERGVPPVSEAVKHIAVACAAVLVSRLIGNWINGQIGGS